MGSTYYGNDYNVDTILMIFGVYSIIALVVCLLQVIGMWKVFKKAGRPGWGALIPIYNMYETCKIAFPKKIDTIITLILTLVVLISGIAVTFTTGMEGVTSTSTYSSSSYYYSASGAAALPGLIMFFAGIVLFIYQIRMYIKLSHSFGKSGVHVLGFLFLGTIWWLVFAFGSSFVYRGQDGTGHPAVYDGIDPTSMPYGQQPYGQQPYGQPQMQQPYQQPMQGQFPQQPQPMQAQFPQRPQQQPYGQHPEYNAQQPYIPQGQQPYNSQQNQNPPGWL